MGNRWAEWIERRLLGRRLPTFRYAALVHDDELPSRAQEWAERTAVEHGLPAMVEDTAVIRHVLRLMGLLDSDGTPVEDIK